MNRSKTTKPVRHKLDINLSSDTLTHEDVRQIGDAIAAALKAQGWGLDSAGSFIAGPAQRDMQFSKRGGAQ